MPKSGTGLVTVPLQAVIDSAMEAAEEGSLPRGYVGASMVASECERSVWYDFRWATVKRWSGRLLRRFQSGHIRETRIIERLKQAGFEVHHENPRAKNEKKQYRAEALGGLLAGHLDGFLKAGANEWLLLRPKAWHLLEIKEMASAKYAYEDDTYETPIANKHPIEHPTYKGNPSNIEGRWWRTRRLGVKKAHQEHYGQMQAYMGLSRMPHPNGKPFYEMWGIDAPLDVAIYIAVNSDTEQIHAELVEYEPKWFKAIERRAMRVVRAKTPPDRCKESPLFPPCKFCDHAPVCHFGEPMNVTCRTCEHSEIKLPGDRGFFGNRAQWLCALHGRQLDDKYTPCAQYAPIAAPIEF